MVNQLLEDTTWREGFPEGIWPSVGEEPRLASFRRQVGKPEVSGIIIFIFCGLRNYRTFLLTVRNMIVFKDIFQYSVGWLYAFAWKWNV